MPLRVSTRDIGWPGVAIPAVFFSVLHHGGRRRLSEEVLVASTTAMFYEST